MSASQEKILGTGRLISWIVTDPIHKQNDNIFVIKLILIVKDLSESVKNLPNLAKKKNPKYYQLKSKYFLRYFCIINRILVVARK